LNANRDPQFTAGRRPRPAGWQQGIGLARRALQRRGWEDGSGKDKDMTDPKDMSDPQVRPPFWHHRYYYLALKIIVLLAGVLIALRIVGLW
jgi:hypothetical protein